MFNKLFKYSMVSLLITACFSLKCFALSPLAMLEDGKRAFDLANWDECREILERFMETWPEHEKYSEALYFHTIACAKTIDSRTEAYRSKLGKELEESIASLSLDLPDMDISEAKAALKIAQKTKKPELWDELTKLTPSELKHYLARGWYPEPTETPFETLKWLKSKQANDTDLDSETKAKLALIKLSALWKLMISPLVVENSQRAIEDIGCFPLDKAFRESLNIAFSKGNPAQKREAAIFGYHFDYFKNNSMITNKTVNSSWLRYLKSRGISFKDAWSPK